MVFGRKRVRQRWVARPRSKTEVAGHFRWGISLMSARVGRVGSSGDLASAAGGHSLPRGGTILAVLVGDAYFQGQSRG